MYKQTQKMVVGMVAASAVLLCAVNANAFSAHHVVLRARAPALALATRARSRSNGGVTYQIRRRGSMAVGTKSNNEKRESERSRGIDADDLIANSADSLLPDYEDASDNWLELSLDSSESVDLMEGDASETWVADGLEREAQVFRTRCILLAVAALYGTNFASIKLMQEQLIPPDAALLRFTLALVSLSPFLRTTPKALWRPGIGIGIWVAFGYIVQGVGLNR